VHDPVAGEHFRPAVVHRNRDRHLHGLLAFLQNVDEVLIDPEGFGHQPQLLACDLEGVFAQMRDGSLYGRHDALLSRDAGRVYVPI